VQQAQVEAEVQVDAELTADELSEIEKLLKSLLED
jgi:F0F1-type ATP synthase delta subunit